MFTRDAVVVCSKYTSMRTAFERAMLKERTHAGLDAARKEGRIGGRPPKLKPQQRLEIVKLVKKGKKTAADAARLFGVHPATVSRLLRQP